MNTNNAEIITVSTSEYLSEETAMKISSALWGQNDIAGMRSILYWHRSESDCFNVTARNASGNFVGRVFCIRNTDDPTLWYYGDLFVAESYRRRHIAQQMLGAAFDTLKDKGCKTIRTYVAPENTPSLELQKKLGFSEKPYRTFNSLINDGDIMFEKQLGQIYKAVPVSSRFDVRIIADIYNKNLEALHGDKISYAEWLSAIMSNDTDEKNYLICRGIMPVAWLKINGLDDTDVGYISMLAVIPQFQRSGVGTFAVEFAENFLHSEGKKIVCVQTTSDNMPAVRLYEKCGFERITEAPPLANSSSGTPKIKFIKKI